MVLMDILYYVFKTLINVSKALPIYSDLLWPSILVFPLLGIGLPVIFRNCLTMKLEIKQINEDVRDVQLLNRLCLHVGSQKPYLQTSPDPLSLIKLETLVNEPVVLHHCVTIGLAIF